MDFDRNFNLKCIWSFHVLRIQKNIIGKRNTFEPLLSGQPWGMASWPFNRGGRLIEVCPIWTRIWSNFLLFTFKSLFIIYKSILKIILKNNLNRKTVPNKTKKNLSNFDKDQAFNTRNLVHTNV